MSYLVNGKGPHIFGKTSRKQAVRDARAMQIRYEDAQRALARTMYAMKYMAKLLDEHLPEEINMEMQKEAKAILTGKKDAEILKDAGILKEEGADGVEKNGDDDASGVRETLSEVQPTPSGEGSAREPGEGEESGDSGPGGKNSGAHDGDGEELL